MDLESEDERVNDHGRRVSVEMLVVRALVDEYVTEPGAGHREITVVDDLYDAGSGLPR